MNVILYIQPNGYRKSECTFILNIYKVKDKTKMHNFTYEF